MKGSGASRAAGWGLVAALAVAMAGAGALGQQPLFRASVDLVVIDVTVVDGSGEPVEGLGPEQFLVRVDGAPRKALAAQWVGYGRPQEPAVTAGPVDRSVGRPAFVPPPRRIYFVIDLAGIQSGSERDLTLAASRLLDRMAPNDLVGLITLPKSIKPVELTTNRRRVRDALSRLAGDAEDYPGALNIALSEAFDIERGDNMTLARVVERECPDARLGPDCPLQVESEAQTIVDLERRHTYETSERLIGLMDELRPVEGPKTVVLVIGGLALDRDLTPVAAVEEAASASRTSLYVIHVPRRRADVTRALAPPAGLADERMERDGLETLTGLAGGTVITLVGAADRAFGRVERELSAQYLLSIETAPGDRDGKPHAIEVKVARPGLQVRARRRFVAAAQPVERRARLDPTVLLPPEVAEAGTASPELDAVLERAGAYLAAYERQFSGLVAEERYDQATFRRRPEGHWEAESRRRLVSDFLLAKAPGASGWTPFRDVVEVDGTKVVDREDRLRRLFLDAPDRAFDQARRITEEGARYNLGSVERTVNVPTLALLFLAPANQSRSSFRKVGEEAVDGTSAWRVGFREEGRPTVVRGRSGDLPAQGLAWIVPQTGQVLRTRLVVPGEVGRLDITVGYRRDARLGLLVPAEMREVYETMGARLEGTARYSNVRRFEVVTEAVVK